MIVVIFIMLVLCFYAVETETFAFVPFPVLFSILYFISFWNYLMQFVCIFKYFLDFLSLCFYHVLYVLANAKLGGIFMWLIKVFK